MIISEISEIFGFSGFSCDFIVQLSETIIVI